ncbi:MAG: DNA methyltransferase [Planctomycetota bacterium]
MARNPETKPLPFTDTRDEIGGVRGIANGDKNKLFAQDRAAHDWYRFVLSFPPQLVREYMNRLDVDTSATVLDPFCGTGTTLVECKKQGVKSVGFEAHPMAAFASRVKTNWAVDPDAISDFASRVARAAERQVAKEGTELRRLPPGVQKLLLKGSISPRPLHKTRVLLETIRNQGETPCTDHALLAVANALVNDIGNLHFGPEVGVRGDKEDAPVIACWKRNVGDMVTDLRKLQDKRETPARAWCHDSRQGTGALDAGPVDAVITSPPYPNEKDYTRTTRLETVLLGFVSSRKELRSLKQNLLRSNTRNVYKDDDDDRWIDSFPRVQELAERIEARRNRMGKTSGFERQYHRVVRLYFGGMARHFAELRPLLRPGARLAYVVGDQASFLRVMIRTGQILAEIAESLGYQVEDIDLFRTRLATATKEQLREEILLLRWPG